MITLSNKNIYSLLGIALVAIIIILSSAGLQWPALISMNNLALYKQITGYTLFICIGYQWYLGISRYKDKKFKQKIERHRLIGMLLPIGFYFHVSFYGYAYQKAIWVIFITACLTAYINPEFFKINTINWKRNWFILHISLSTMLTSLLIYHIFIVYLYS